MYCNCFSYRKAYTTNLITKIIYYEKKYGNH